MSGQGRRRGAVALMVAAVVAAGCASGSSAPAAGTASPGVSDTVVPNDTVPNDTVPNDTAAAFETPAATAPPEPERRYLSGDSEYLFDQDTLHTFEINVSEALLATLNEDPAAEEYAEGSLTFEGETIAPIGVRYKGSVGAFVGCTDGPNPLVPSGAKTCDKLSLKLKINWDDPNGEFYGVRKVLLHSQNLDPTLMHERLGYWLFREMGVPAPRSTHARVMINGEFAGVFALTEEIDGRFTRENFEDGAGNLYKEVWPFDANHAPATSQALIDSLQTNENDDPNADIMTAFTAELAAAAPEAALEVIAKWIDIDNLLTTFVVDRAIRNDDGPLHWYCIPECNPHNFYWYEDPSSRQLTLIPWDLDNAFDSLTGTGLIAGFIEIADELGEITNDCQPFPFGSFGLLQISAACDPLVGPLTTLDEALDGIRAELVAGPLSDDRVAQQLERWSAQIESSVAEFADAHPSAQSVETWRAALAAMQRALSDSLAGTGR